MTNKQLAKILRSTGSSLFDRTYDPDYKLLLDEAADRLENQGQWISVDERLPDKEGTYLTYTDKNKMLFDVFCIYPSHGTKFWVGGNGEVTHWMPLPEAPKMKGGSELERGKG